MRNFRNLLFVIPIFIFPVVSFALSSSQSEEGLIQTVTFSLEDLSLSKIDGYDRVVLADYSHTNESGKPQLPLRTVHVAIPAGAKVTGVEVMASSKKVLPRTYNVYPGQPPRTLSLDRGLSYNSIGFVEPDPTIYSSSNPYPGKLVEFAHQGDLAGQELACILIYPIQYIPLEKKLVFYTKIEFKVEYVLGAKETEPARKMSERSRALYEEMIKGMVLNPEDVVIPFPGEVQSMGVPPGDFDHVIITNNTLKSSFQNLLNWHNKKGVPDTVVTTEWIYANYSGSDNQAKIRAFIKDANTTWGTVFFLLGGDVSVVPVKTKYFSITGEYVPGDTYYSDLDDDWYMEVFVGRASVQSASEVNTFVNKVLTYEKTPPTTNYPAKAFFFAFDLDTYPTRSEYCKENYIDPLVPTQFDPITKEYDSQSGTHKTDCINAL